MSDGPFLNSFYEDDDGGIHPIRVQPETVAVNGGAATGPSDNDISAQVGGSRRTYGLHARGLRLVRTFGTGDNTGRRYNFLPVQTPTAFATFNKGSEFTYNTFTWTIAAKVPEKSV